MEELSGLPLIVPVPSISPGLKKNVGRRVETKKDHKPKWEFGSTDIRYVEYLSLKLKVSCFF